MELPTLKNFLIKIREKLSPPGAWLQKAFAQDKDSKIVPVRSLEACRWCLVGAIHASIPSEFMDKKQPIDEMWKKAEFLEIGKLAKWNDSTERTQEEVLQTLDTWIKRCD